MLSFMQDAGISDGDRLQADQSKWALAVSGRVDRGASANLMFLCRLRYGSRVRVRGESIQAPAMCACVVWASTHVLE